jgi:outer membrane protein assembly factor BamA
LRRTLSNSIAPGSLVAGLAVTLVVVFAMTGRAKGSLPQRRYVLERIEVSGINRYTEKDVIEASGLRVGQQVDTSAFEVATSRLIASGLFAEVVYKYRTVGPRAFLAFEVTEAEWEIPVVFDNFVWFSDDELVGAVRKEVPTFDGTAPASAGVTESIKRVLEGLLSSRGIRSQVEYLPSSELTGGNRRHVFRVRDLDLPICTLSYPGAASVSEAELVRKSDPILGKPYSRLLAFDFAQHALRLVYRERGHLRVAFSEPLAKPESAAACPAGVRVAVPVQEGAVYYWDKAEWTGNEALSTAELDASLGMKTGELANGVKMDRGVSTARYRYGKKGFIEASLRPRPQFDEARHTVTYQLSVNEGPQYRMGKLTISGLPAGEIERLSAKWDLRPGAIYDDSYIDDFTKMYLLPVVARVKRKPEITTRPNRQTLTVDVSITIP